MKLKNDQMRQGDVLLIVDRLNEETSQEKNEGERTVLAHGEATGHAHAVYDAGAHVSVTPKKARYLQLVQPSFLLHEEHTKIDLDKKSYRVLRQTEWTDENEPRKVAD